jgi:hypothetical protein
VREDVVRFLCRCKADRSKNEGDCKLKHTVLKQQAALDTAALSVARAANVRRKV